MEQEDQYNITFTSWNKVAHRYQEKFMDLDLYNDSYDRFCELIKEHGNILEIGCGPGNITRYLLNKRPDLRILATDVAPEMIRLAKENNPAAECSVIDCRTIASIKRTFDGILCGFCLPYLSREDTARLIEDAAALLNTGGCIYLSCMEGDPAHSGYETGSTGDRMYVYYHDEMFLTDQLKKSNFELLNVLRKTMGDTNHNSSVHLILVAKKINSRP